jgi:hypothetical protein
MNYTAAKTCVYPLFKIFLDQYADKIGQPKCEIPSEEEEEGCRKDVGRM